MKSGSSCAWHMLQAGKLIQPINSLIIKGKTLFVSAKSPRVVIATAVYQSRRMLYVKHLVIDDVIDEPRRHFSGIQGLADRYCFVNRIVVAQNPPCSPLRPRQRRLWQFTGKILFVQPIKYLIE